MPRQAPARAIEPATEPRRVSAEARKKLLLAAARDAFIESGYAGARPRDIASTTGVTEAMIYRHFRSKKQLFEEAVAQPIEDAVNHILATPFPPLPPSDGTAHMRQRTKSFFLDMLTALREVGPLLGVVLFADRESGTHYYQERIEPAFQRLVELTTDTLNQWSHREFNSATVQRAVFGMCWTMSLDDHFGSHPASDLNQLAEELTQILFDGIATQ